jgi:serine/threonine protein phosphatase PrpC
MTMLKYCGRSDIGPKRAKNEDSYVCLDLASRIPRLEDPAALLIVADGVGGQAGGGVASRLAADTLQTFLVGRLTTGSLPPDWPALLVESFREANRKILARINEDINLTGMGTTLVAALVSRGVAFVANVGDSRAYHVRAREIVQVTQDHSWAAEQKRVRTISDWEIRRSPFRHMITRSLGFEADVQADVFRVTLADGDFLLLCSDGLTSVLADREILRVFLKFYDPEEICRRLLKSAERAGTRDNITTVVARWDGDPGKSGRPPRAGGRVARSASKS